MSSSLILASNSSFKERTAREQYLEASQFPAGLCQQGERLTAGGKPEAARILSIMFIDLQPYRSIKVPAAFDSFIGNLTVQKLDLMVEEVI